MKIVVMIPAYNEEDSIERVIQRIPAIEGHKVQILVINDGSSDHTAEVAEKAGAIVLNNNKNRGLGVTFKKGLKNALNMDADIIVNIDADGQYNPEDIPRIVEPIINDEADMVLGSRMENLKYDMPSVKKIGNKFMTKLLSIITETKIKDGQTGFRGFSKTLAQTLLVFLKGEYTYTQETLIHAIFNDFRIKQIEIEFNAREHGESRLIKNALNYFVNASRILINTYKYYKPMKFFGFVGLLLLVLGIAFLVMDQYNILIGTHFIPGLDITNDPKIIVTIIVPIILALLFLIFGVILDTINRSRTSTIQTNVQLKEELKLLRRSVERLESKHLNTEESKSENSEEEHEQNRDKND